jgi:photosystem I P700 chlorophyll a apoprotein A2
LGFHVLGVYVHNDSVVAFGSPYKQLLLEPVLSQSTSRFLSAFSIQPLRDSIHLSPISGSSLSFASEYTSSLLGPGDFLATHACALGLHVTSLILLKGALDARGSSLLPDKSQFGFSFACDGPARGGTCDVSSWDAFYLAFFWLLNSNSWSMFYIHWRHLLFWASLGGKFDESSTYLNGWFRDYLWFNSASLIRGYDPLGVNDISVWAWSFLLAHLCWAVGFMFLISWRGYWQELIDSISYMHLKTPFLFSLWDGGFYTPSALSILQARFIGLVHFASGLIVTYAAFVLGATT